LQTSVAIFKMLSPNLFMLIMGGFVIVLSATAFQDNVPSVFFLPSSDESSREQQN